MSHLESLPVPRPSERDASADSGVDIVPDGDTVIILRFPVGMSLGTVREIIDEMRGTLEGQYVLLRPEKDPRDYDEFTARRNAKRITYYFMPTKLESMDPGTIRQSLRGIMGCISRR